MHAFRQGSADDYGNFYPFYYAYNQLTDSYTIQNCSDVVGNHSYITTDGQLLHSGTYIEKQISCNPNTGNSGYYYTWVASNPGSTLNGYGDQSPNSICPKGWQLTTNTATDTRSFYNLINVTYNLATNSQGYQVSQAPLSFVRSGAYSNGSPTSRGPVGYYYSSAVRGFSNCGYYLLFAPSALGSKSSNDPKYMGYSLRCVAR